MKILLAVATLFLPPWGQDERTYHLETTASIEQTAGQAPAIVCKGVTDLPDGAILQVTALYAAKTEIEIDYVRISVAEGNFNARLPLPGDPLFPGTYRCRVSFDRSLQYREVREKTASVTTTLTWEAQSTVGVPGDAEAVAMKFRETIAADLGKYREVLDDVDRYFLEAIRDVNKREGWELQSRAWKASVQEVVKRHVGRKAYHFAGIGPATDQTIDGLAHLLHLYVDESRKLLDLPKQKPADRSVLTKMRARFDYAERSFRHTLGLLPGNEKELREAMLLIRRLYSTLENWYKEQSTGIGDNAAQQWNDWKEEWLPQLSATLQRLAEIVDPENVNRTLELSLAANEVVAHVDRLVAGEKVAEKVDEGMKEFSRIVDALGKRLKVDEHGGE